MMEIGEGLITWAQFKALIDAELKRQGLPDDVCIGQINVDWEDGSDLKVIYNKPYNEIVIE